MNNSVVKIKLFFFAGFLCISTFGQSYLGFNTDNYSGLHGVVSNPGNIADSRIRADINLFSLSVLGANDYLGLSLDNMSGLIKGDDFADFNKNPSNSNNLLLDLDVLGPSFMFKLKPNQSVGLITRLRGVNNINNFSGQLFEGFIDGFPTNDFSFQQNNFDGTSHIWGEVGISYGRILFDDRNRNFLKGGMTLKYLVGLGFYQVYSDNVSGNFNAELGQIELNGDFSQVSNIEDTIEDYNFSQNMVPGFGFDIGFVYEYRTRSSQSYNGRENPDAINNYRFKLGISLMDIGTITYKNVVLKNYDLNGSIDATEAEDDIVLAIEEHFAETTDLGDVTIALPTSLRLTLDYKLSNRFYLNLDVDQTLVKKDNPFNNNRLNLIALTPRYETRRIGFYVPFAYSSMGRHSIGFGLKLGSLILGSGSILGNLATNSSQTVNFYLGFKAPIHYKRR